jgi:hypothetical protein
MRQPRMLQGRQSPDDRLCLERQFVEFRRFVITELIPAIPWTLIMGPVEAVEKLESLEREARKRYLSETATESVMELEGNPQG